MKMKKKIPFFACVLGACLILGGFQSISAQDDEDTFMLEEITVTAAKRSENQQKVAIAMETISAEELKASGRNNIDDILSTVASVIINKAGDGLRVSIRGMADTGSTQHGMSVSMPTVAVNKDGVYSNRKDTGSGLFDLERVEVLFGPQSTLYSSNSPGGIVNVVTANPKVDLYEGSATIEYGNYNLLHTEGVVNVPITATTALRGAFSTNQRDGYLSNGGDNEDSKSARLRALYQPSETLSFVLTGEVSKSSTQRSSGVNGFYDGYYQDGTKVDDYWYSSDELPGPTTDTNESISAKVDLDMGFATLSVLPSYSDRSGHAEERMAMGDEITLNKSDTSATEKSIEVRMASGEDAPFKWIAGANYYYATNIQNSLAFDGSGNPNMSVIAETDDPSVVAIGDTVQEFRNMDSKEEAKAVFANVTYPITEAFRATLGIRYSWDDVTMNNDETRGIRGGPNTGLLEFTSETFEDPYSDPDYKVGVEYDLGPNSMLFADFSTSYRVQAMGGGGPGTTGDQEKEPERLQAYSLGAKNRFLNNKLQVNATAFYYSYTGFSAGDLQTGFFGDPEDETNYINDYTQNDPNSSQQGDGRMYGADVQTNVIVTSKDMLNLSVSYLKSEWTDLTFDYYYDYLIVGVEPGQPWGRDNIVEATTVSYNGKPMTMSPEWTISANYNHNFVLPNGSSIKAQIEERYKSGYHLSWKDANDPWDYQESCFVTNLSATYTSQDGKWSLNAYVRNLEDYAEKRMYMTPGGGAGVTTLGNPRTFGAVFSARF